MTKKELEAKVKDLGAELIGLKDLSIHFISETLINLSI